MMGGELLVGTTGETLGWRCWLWTGAFPPMFYVGPEVRLLWYGERYIT